MTNSWSAARRKQQSLLIHDWRPWQRSTGPLTSEGKARSSRNAFRGAVRGQLRVLARVLRQQRNELS